MLDLIKHFPLRKKEKPRSIKILQWVYLAILLSVIGFVTVLHNTDPSFLPILRLPIFFKEAEDYVKVSYMNALTVYHFTFAYFVLIFTIDIISFFNYSHEFLRKVSLLATIFGFAIFGLIGLYFLYSLILLLLAGIDIALSSLVFFALSIFFFTLDLITFLIEERSLNLPS